jgi:hypothetical protein
MPPGSKADATAPGSAAGESPTWAKGSRGRSAANGSGSGAAGVCGMNRDVASLCEGGSSTATESATGSSNGPDRSIGSGTSIRTGISVRGAGTPDTCSSRWSRWSGPGRGRAGGALGAASERGAWRCAGADHGLGSCSVNASR